MKIYKREYEWNDQAVRAGRNGWLIDYNSSEQGAMTGRTIRVPFSSDFPRGCDLDDDWNGGMTIGDYLIEMGEQYRDRVIRTGHEVE